jgi:hypothetical protein
MSAKSASWSDQAHLACIRHDVDHHRTCRCLFVTVSNPTRYQKQHHNLSRLPRRSSGVLVVQRGQPSDDAEDRLLTIHAGSTTRSVLSTVACQVAAASAVFSKSIATSTFDLLLKHPEPLCSTLRFAHQCACACNASIDDPLTQLHSVQLARRDFSPAQRFCEMQTAWCQVTRAGVLHAPCRWQHG